MSETTTTDTGSVLAKAGNCAAKKDDSSARRIAVLASYKLPPDTLDDCLGQRQGVIYDAIMADRASRPDTLDGGETEAEPVGELCTNCGSSWSDERLAREKAERPELRSCCPERKIVPVYASPPADSLKAEVERLKAAAYHADGDLYRDLWKQSRAAGARGFKRANELRDDLARLQAFKDYTHKRLDEAGVPTHPDGEHSKAGCRIGDRMDIMADRASRPAEKMVEFTRWVISSGWWQNGSLEGDEIQEKAFALGLVTKRPFDPAVDEDPHGACEAGDDWFEFGAALASHQEASR